MSPKLCLGDINMHPHAGILIAKIRLRTEQVQKRAARFVYNNYRSKEPGCVTNILDALNWEPLS
jgi:hypothetical protein